MSLNDFMNKVKKVSGNRTHKIKNSYGVYDYYKAYRKNKPKDKEFILTEKEYYNILRRMNDLLVDSISEGVEVNLPCRMGKIEIRRYKIEPRIDKEGNLIYKAPIDWDATLKLWYEDKEAKKDKTLIKIESSSNFRIFYNKMKATFNNKSVYLFNINRNLKKKVSDAIKREEIDGFTYKF